MPEDIEIRTISEGCGPLAPPTTLVQPPLKQQVFECVRSLGEISRVDVAKRLGVSPASVTAVVAELIATGLVTEREARPRDGHRGRPPVSLSVNRESGRVVGLKLSDATHTAVLMDHSGQTLEHATLASSAPRRGADRLLAETAELFEIVLDRAGLSPDEILAVGIGVPGGIDHDAGRVRWSPILSEEDVPFAKRASARLGVPVSIDNDANLVTLAELWFGAGRQMRDFAVITIEHGVGMGMVIDNALYRGAHGLAMELGHIKVQLDGALCRCGQRGCLEAYVADYALVREASTALNWQPIAPDSNQILLESLFDQAKAGHESARAIFRRAGRYLAVALANVVNIFDPSLIILSGERMRYDYLYAETVLAEMRALSLYQGRKVPRVEINAWGDLVWARGAAALALTDATPRLVAKGAVAGPA